MLQVHDIRESRVFQEAKEEGVKEGIEKGVKEGIEKERQRAIARMAALKMSDAEIAAILEVDVELVRKALAGTDRV